MNLVQSLSLALFYFIFSVYSTERCCQQYRCDIDSPPGGKYTCEQQHHMNKCDEHWMKGYCCQTCSSSCPERKCNIVNKTEYLAIDKRTKNFIFNGHYIFLNGANQAWFEYGNDFGAHRKPQIEKHFTTLIQQIKAAGGNVVRVWVFGEGKHYPIFDKNNKVIKSDATNILIQNIVSYLEIAEKNDIFVILTLWDAVMEYKGHGLYKLLTDDTNAILQSFIDVVLTPLVEATNDYVSLAAWDIINEPERRLLPQHGNTHCTDTMYLKDEGPDYRKTQLSVDKFQRFINIHSAAIKAVDSEALVTIGAWSEKSSTDRLKYKNLWSDACLIESGKYKNGILDFYSIHSYQYTGFYGTYAPFGDKLNSVRFYDLDKAVIIGEFGIEHGGPQWETMKREYYAKKKYKEIYRKGFNGALMWSMADQKRIADSDGAHICMEGMSALRNMTDVNVDMSDTNSSLSRLLRIFGVLFVALLLFGKTCMVFVCCLCFRAFYKCCKKSETDNDDDVERGSYDSVFEEGGAHRWSRDELYMCIMKGIWIAIGILCALGVVVLLVCAVVLFIEIRAGQLAF